MSSLRSRVSMPSRPFSAYSTSMPYCSSTQVSAKMLRTSSSTMRILRPDSTSSSMGAVVRRPRPRAAPAAPSGAGRPAAGSGARFVAAASAGAGVRRGAGVAGRQVERERAAVARAGWRRGSRRRAAGRSPG